jgi:flagellar assembly protein FliH
MYSEPSLSAFDTGRFLPGKPHKRRAAEPQETLTAWQRWEMASFAEELSAAPRAQVAEPELQPFEPALLIDEAELARLRLEAQKAGEAGGYEQGYARGLADGQAAGLAAARAQAGQLHALTLALPAALRIAENKVADELLALALDIAKQVLGQALTVDPQAILAVVHELLQAEPALSGAPQLLLHADDAALVKEHLADELKGVGWRIRVDAHIKRGGCRVLASGGERDATLETRWERVTASLARNPPAAPPTDQD